MALKAILMIILIYILKNGKTAPNEGKKICLPITIADLSERNIWFSLCFLEKQEWKLIIATVHVQHTRKAHDFLIELSDACPYGYNIFWNKKEF